ncbi:MAG TPA: tetratricopeptide repeat protein [Pyrinomonadaceae bacterium]|jgi:tetratricopeptide (TPR) repeat protein
MGFDKTKVVRAAEKYLALGKIPAAIKEYRQIVENDPSDFTALNMLGDLYVRTDKKKEAIACFARIADHYREQGFALKAIAMYKKIDRLNPAAADIASRLAALYESQGLIVEARAQYLVVADAYTRAGQAQKALEVLRKIADLDPQNTEVRLKLAEGYLRENFRSDAAEAYLEAGAQLFARGAHERALDIYTKALDLSPHNRAALSGLVSVQIALGSPDEAAEALERALQVEPNDVELWSMLAHAYIEAEDAPAAERATAKLVSHEPSSYQRFADVARLYLKAGDTDAATRVIAGIAEQLLAGRGEKQLLDLLNEVLALNPEQVEALRLLVRLHTWQHDTERLVAVLERLAEAAEAAQLVEDEHYALSQLVRLAPEEPRYLQRLRALGISAEAEGAGAAHHPFEHPSHDVPTFESFMPNVEAEATARDALGGGATEFEWNAVTPPSASDPASSFADLNEDWAGADAGSHDPSTTAAPPPLTGFNEFDFSSPETSTPPHADRAVETDNAFEIQGGATEVRHADLLRQELESVDFYLAQGYTDIALDTLDMLERQFGAQEEINARRTQIQKAIPADPAAAAAPPVADAAPPHATSDASVEFSGFKLYDVAEEAMASSSTEDAAAGDIDAAFMELEAAAPPLVPAAEPASATTRPETSQANVPVNQKAGIDPGLAAIFDEFRTAVEEEEPVASDSDYETHYNLGLAYKEMDLLDEAVEEFQTAAALVAPQDGTPRYLQCCNLLGHCFMQKGMPRVAVMWFKKGLDAPGHTEDEYQALRYELGTSYEQMGELDQAIDVFSEVYGINVSYRGVADKLRDLQAQKTSK